MKNVLSILEGLVSGVDLATCETLVDERYLDSLGVVALVAELEDEFGITIPAVEVVADNFNSAAKIEALVSRLSGEGC